MSDKWFKRTALRGCVYLFAVVAQIAYVQETIAAQVTLQWEANSETGLAGYKVHYGTHSRIYTNFIDVGRVTRYSVTGLQEGATYYFAVTAYNTSGVESGYSNEVSTIFCASAISPASQSFGGSGGSATVSVTSTPGCSWSASSGVSWVAIASGSSGTGNGTVVLNVAPNTGVSRGAGISIAGEIFTVTQAAGSTTAKSYTITASAGINGSITPSGEVSVPAGASQTFSIAPKTGYRIYSVKVDGKSVGPVSTYTFSNVNAGHTIDVRFQPAATKTGNYTITASAGINGSITPSGEVSVPAGASQTFSIAPKTGYRIYSVTVDGKSVGPVSTYTFTNVNAGHTINARFQPR
ncbi:MAG: hypothetical protein C4576_21530 [Desulfobacteraceae bacterium]|nr:MAG: hypothetical protein C4576_21530 [Desulfobacteraceae bacterium]